MEKKIITLIKNSIIACLLLLTNAYTVNSNNKRTFSSTEEQSTNEHNSFNNQDDSTTEDDSNTPSKKKLKTNPVEDLMIELTNLTIILQEKESLLSKIEQITSPKNSWDYFNGNTITMQDIINWTEKITNLSHTLNKIHSNDIPTIIEENKNIETSYKKKTETLQEKLSLIINNTNIQYNEQIKEKERLINALKSDQENNNALYMQCYEKTKEITYALNQNFRNLEKITNTYKNITTNLEKIIKKTNNITEQIKQEQEILATIKKQHEQTLKIEQSTINEAITKNQREFYTTINQQMRKKIALEKKAKDLESKLRHFIEDIKLKITPFKQTQINNRSEKPEIKIGKIATRLAILIGAITYFCINT